MTQAIDDTTTEVNQVMAHALLQLKKLINDNRSETLDLLTVVKTFLLGVISTAVDLVELEIPGSTPFLYADVEAAAKTGGLHAIKEAQSTKGTVHYSVSDIDPDDVTTAMNYLGQALGTTLFKGIHELPMPLREPEMLLRGVEALLTNLLNQKFDNSHQVLESFSEHVRMALDDLESRKH